MPYARIDKLNLYYEVDGEGLPLVLLHGLGSSSADWGLQVPAFAARHRVIAVDLRGHGRSLDGARSYSVRDMADDVAALLAQLNQPAAHVVGLSLGGCVALALGLGHPGRVRSLVLVNTFARLRPAGLRGAMQMVRRLWLFATAPMPKTAAFVAAGLFPKPEHRHLRDEAVIRLSRNKKLPYLSVMRAIAGFDVRKQLDQMRCPTLILAGDHDNTVPRAAVEALQRGIPGAQLALIEDSGHATPYDQTEAFNAAVLRFIEGREWPGPNGRLPL